MQKIATKNHFFTAKRKKNAQKQAVGCGMGEHTHTKRERIENRNIIK